MPLPSHTPPALWLAQMTTGPAPEGNNPPAGAPPAPTPSTPPAAGPTLQTVTSAPGTTGAVAGTQGDAKPGGFLGGMMGILPIILMLVALYFILIRGQRKEEKRRKGLIAELKKGDRVMTIGGLVARVVSIDGDEVVLKIDESNNTKATYRKSAIQEVLTGGEEKK